MPRTHSVSIIAPVAVRDAAIAYLVEAFPGEFTLSNMDAEASANGSAPASHLGCHLFHSEEFLTTLQAAKASSDPGLDVLNTVIIDGEESDLPTYDDVLADSGLQRVQVTTDP